MSVRIKLTVGFLVIISLLWAIIVVAQNTYTSIHQEFEALEGDIIPGAIAMGDMENAANEAAHELMDYLVFGEEESKQIVLSATKDLEEAGLEHLEHETHIGQEEQKVAEELLVKINVFNSAVAEIIDLKEQGVSVEEVLKRENETIHPSFDSLIEQLEEHKAVHIEEMAAAEYLVSKAVSSGVLILFLVGGLTTLLAVTVRLFAIRSIVNPLQALHKGTEIIGEGNFDYKVGTKAKDEIGQLSRAFDQMTENLKKSTTSIDNLNKEITERKRAEHSLDERIKALNCLYGIANIAERPGVTLDELYQEVVNLLLVSWQYPEITCTRANIDGKEFETENCRETEWKLTSDIRVRGAKAGEIQVIYLEERPELDEGPFLKEERLLIDAVAERLGRITERKRAEEEIQIQRARFESIFEHSIEGIVTLDINNNILEANTGFENIYGYKQEEILGKRLDDLIVPERFYYGEAKELDNMALDGILGYETIRKRKDGTEINVSLSAGPIKTGEEFGGRFVIFRDITERKQAEEALRRAEKDWRSSFDSLEDIMTIIDNDYTIENMNESGLALLGKRREEVIGRKCYQVIYDRETPGEYCPCSLAMRTKQVESTEHYDERSGRYFSIKISPVFDENGEIVKFVDLRRDVTERKQAEKALQESEERYRALVNLGAEVGEAIIMLEDNEQGEGIQTFMNDQWPRITGYSKEELHGMSFFKLVHPKDRQASQERHRKKISGEAIAGLFEISIIRKDGTEVPIELTSAFTTYMGKYANVVYIRDITERKQAEEEREALLKELERINLKLEESNRELQDFVYVASHDLREPLRKITSFGTLLQDSLGGKLDEDQRENFEFMIDGSKRMQTMIDDLLLYSRVTTEAKQFGQVNLNDVIEDLKSLELAVLLDEIRGTIHVPEMLPPVQGDSSQIHQLLQNLVGNGLKFHRKGVLPEITIRARRIENDMVRVEVQDNGIGIDKEYYEQVFTMFKRLHSKMEYKGTGIGLAVCKKIVQRHGGEIGVESTPGEGSIFWFTLPRGSY